MWHEINATPLKVLTSISYPFLFSHFHFFPAHIKNSNWFLMLFCLPLEHADDIVFFYRNLHCSIRVNKCHHRTVYMQVVPKFIRSISHNAVIGLLKSLQCVEGFKLSVFCEIQKMMCGRMLHAALFTGLEQRQALLYLKKKHYKKHTVI